MARKIEYRVYIRQLTAQAEAAANATDIPTSVLCLDWPSKVGSAPGIAVADMSIEAALSSSSPDGDLLLQPSRRSTGKGLT